PGDSWNARTREKFLRFLREKASRFYAFALRIGRNRHDTGSRTMLIAIDSSRGLSPSQTIGGVPKKRGRQAPFDSAVPPPPTQTVGGQGRISREKCRFLVFEAVIWRRGVPPFGRMCDVCEASAIH